MANAVSFGVAAPPAPAQKSLPAKKPPGKKPAPKSAGGVKVPPSTVQQYRGAYSAGLNNLSGLEQREHDVAARRQADAKQYAAYVLGKQGSIAAAAHQQDQKALLTQTGIQQIGAKSGLALQDTLQKQRAAQGIEGAVPAQQLVAPVDSQQRNNAILTAIMGRTADQMNTNQGKAGFLAAAAQAGMQANQRAIAGQEFENVSKIQGQKTELLARKTDQALESKRAQQAAAADMYGADLAARSADADRSSRVGIEQAKLDAAMSRDSADRQESRYQKSRDRQVRLKVADKYGDTGGQPPKPAALKAYRDANTSTANAASLGGNLLRGAGAARYKANPNAMRAALRSEYPDLPGPGLEFVIAQIYGREPGKGKAGTSEKRYRDYLKKLRQGLE